MTLLHEVRDGRAYPMVLILHLENLLHHIMLGRKTTKKAKYTFRTSSPCLRFPISILCLSSKLSVCGRHTKESLVASSPQSAFLSSEFSWLGNWARPRPVADWDFHHGHGHPRGFRNKWLKWERRWRQVSDLIFRDISWKRFDGGVDAGCERFGISCTRSVCGWDRGDTANVLPRWLSVKWHG